MLAPASQTGAIRGDARELLRSLPDEIAATAFLGWWCNPQGAFCNPVGFMWSSADIPLPWPQLPFTPAAADGTPMTVSESALWCRGYVHPGVGLRAVTECEVPPIDKLAPEQLNYLMSDLSGRLQPIWAFLSTFNRTPIIGERKVENTNRGFVARGRYRKFLDHRIITLYVPAKTDTRKLARRVLTELRRRAHQVRGHFRDDWHKPKGNKSIWVGEHQRGDASLGFVTHDHVVKHEERGPAA